MKDIQPHIRCGKEDAAKYAILPGDPQRVDRVMKFLDNAYEVAYNREFRTAVGYYKDVKVMVTSTGIGAPSTVIVIEELSNIGVETLIRIGSCGALQDGLKIGDLVIASGAVRNDGTSDTYIERSYPAIPDTETLMGLLKSVKELNYRHHYGKIRSHDSFYTDNEDSIDEFWSKKGILAADMESASLFVIGGLRNLKTASILNVVVESSGNLKGGINDYANRESESAKGEEREILTALEAIVKIEKGFQIL